MTVQPLSLHKVTTLPGALTPGSFYAVRRPNGFAMVIGAVDGTPVPMALPYLQAQFGSDGRPRAGQVFGRMLVAEYIDWSAAGSRAIAIDGAAAAQADVEVRRWGDNALVARFRWAAASSQAAVTIFMPTSAPGDLLIFTAPANQDATLAGIAGTLSGQRRTL